MDIFSACHEVNNLISGDNEPEARNHLIRLLDYHKKEGIPYSPIVNHLIRQTGLYPYLQIETSNWQERFVFEAFKVDTGGEKHFTLHREQSSLLKRLINGENIAVSAPTSFGKSFVVDSFISINKPKNVVIIVPTIALTDETRRRIYKKFSDEYKVITTTEIELAEKNIFIFPQERAIAYVNKIQELDILIIDEFYKASSKYDKERSPSLLKAIIKLGRIAKQRYYLAPNITELEENVFTKGMTFENKLDFSTVYLEKHELYHEINNNLEIKSKALLEIINNYPAKSLIYAASYSQIDKVSDLFIAKLPPIDRPILNNFAHWLSLNYNPNWKLIHLIEKGSGIHNGQIHRSLSQIQIKLFEEEEGLERIISTSSIIEGVNTCAENVIIWRNRKGGRGNALLDNFTYKNIIGRGGRMFKHFIGKIFLLEKPPIDDKTQLGIDFPEEILGDLDEVADKESLTKEQIIKIVAFKEEMNALLGPNSYDRLLKENFFQMNNSDLIRKISIDMKKRSHEWRDFSKLNSDNSRDWGNILDKIVNLQPGVWGDGPYWKQHRQFVNFIQLLSGNWNKTIPQLLDELNEFDIGIDLFFKLERSASYKFSSLLNDVNIIYKEIFDDGVDVSSFVKKLSHAFLPSVVYQLEEYGLPRMLARKLHEHQVIDFEERYLTIHSIIERFKEIGQDFILSQHYFDEFDKYIIEYFFDGISTNKK